MANAMIQAHLDLLDCCNSIAEEETVFAQAQENMTAEEFSTFTAISPTSKFLDDPEFNR